VGGGFVDYFDFIALQDGEICEFLRLVAVFDDQQTRRNHLEDKAKRRHVPHGTPDDEPLIVAADAEVYTGAFHCGRNSRKRLRSKWELPLELKRLSHSVRSNEG
jgi:hypothetical protein